jgi:cytochrome c553
MGILTCRPEWTDTLVTALETGLIPPSQIGADARARLLAADGAGIKDRTKKLFSEFNHDRKKPVTEYIAVAGMKGDAHRGAALFRQNCATCHRLNGKGHEVGPDLGTVAGKPTE